MFMIVVSLVTKTGFESCRQTKILSFFRFSCSPNFLSRRFSINAYLLVTVLFLSLLGSSAVASDSHGTTPQFDYLESFDVIGRDLSIWPRPGESLATLARRYGLGRRELQWANPGIGNWNLDESVAVVLPYRQVLPAAPREGIVINLPEFRLFHYQHDLSGSESVVSYPVSIGRMNWQTPIGRLSIVEKISDPDWRPPLSVRLEAKKRGVDLPPLMLPGPKNPLGKFALRLSKTRYLIHGTNKPDGIGMRVSHGCLRLYPADIEKLFEHAETDTVVTVVNQPVKVGRIGSRVLVEVHPPLEEFQQTDQALLKRALLLVKQLVPMADSSLYKDLRLHPERLINAIAEKSGVPTVIALIGVPASTGSP